MVKCKRLTGNSFCLFFLFSVVMKWKHLSFLSQGLMKLAVLKQHFGNVQLAFGTLEIHIQ